MKQEREQTEYKDFPRFNRLVEQVRKEKKNQTRKNKDIKNQTGGKNIYGRSIL